MKLVCTS